METEWKTSRVTESLGTGPEVSGHCQQPAMTPVKEVLQVLCCDRECMGLEQVSFRESRFTVLFSKTSLLFHLSPCTFLPNLRQTRQSWCQQGLICMSPVSSHLAQLAVLNAGPGPDSPLCLLPPQAEGAWWNSDLQNTKLGVWHRTF